ncbi:MAG TPA: NAD(P)/FAD-dependent oxidoreductase [Patescibacteria group bacterium]|nr:NAD(P)/FAD-dependent oxidoreductase [Patescibacteria group bacterium]
MAEKVFDIAIVGGGPAGLSAALTGRIRNKTVAIFEPYGFSAKVQQAHLIDNYPGLPGISGKEMIERMAAHCLEHEPVVIKEKVVNIFPGDPFTLLTPGDTYEAKTIILTTGVATTALLTGEKEYIGRGVAYCATCDGRMYTGKDVAVVSYTAAEEHEVKFLGEICRNVFYLPQYKGDFSHLGDKVRIIGGKPRAVLGAEQVTALATDKEELKVDGIFIMRQSDPLENLLPDLVLENNAIRVNRDLSTNIPGVFAAGDCTGRPWQVAKAVGEGLTAVLSAVAYVDALKK